MFCSIFFFLQIYLLQLKQKWHITGTTNEAQDSDYFIATQENEFTLKYSE